MLEIEFPKSNLTRIILVDINFFFSYGTLIGVLCNDEFITLSYSSHSTKRHLSFIEGYYNVKKVKEDFRLDKLNFRIRTIELFRRHLDSIHDVLDKCLHRLYDEVHTK
jgi:hypothetical protein